MYTPEQVAMAFRAGFIEAAKWPSVCVQDADSDAVYEAADAYAATLKAAQGGVTEAMELLKTAAKYATDAKEAARRIEAGEVRDWDSARRAFERIANGLKGAEQIRAALSAQQGQGEDDFKNFHRLLCERFGYVHDPIDWKRDQLSLIEHIATATAPPAQPAERVPEGMVLVPREPTPKMIEIGRLFSFRPEVIWQNMLSVVAEGDAPTAPAKAIPDSPLSVFSKGYWTYAGTGESFDGETLDQAAFDAYRDHFAASPTSADQGQPGGMDGGVG